MKLLIKIIFFTSIIIIGAGFNSGDQISFRLIVFEGSDWCPHCLRLEREILSDSLFLTQMQSGSVIVERIDFPQRKKLSESTRLYNSAIAEKYDFDGRFPTIILTRSDSFKYLKIKYTHQSTANLITEINQLKSALQ